MVLHVLFDTIDSNLTIILVALIGVIGVLGSGFVGPVVITMMNNRQRAIEREDDRRQRANIASAVADVATTANGIAATGQATHLIVNNQRTVMLRTIATMARRLAKDHPDDLELAKAATDADADLALNIAVNADPRTKVPLNAIGPITDTAQSVSDAAKRAERFIERGA